MGKEEWSTTGMREGRKVRRRVGILLRIILVHSNMIKQFFKRFIIEFVGGIPEK